MAIADKDSFFKPCRVYWWSGYFIPVRNSWSFKIEKRHLSEYERTKYEQTFGTRLITNNEFDKWIAELLLKDN